MMSPMPFSTAALGTRRRIASLFAFWQRRSLQRGDALLNALFAILVMGIISAVYSGAFSGDTSKSTALASNMNTIKDALVRYKMDVGCYPSNLQALWDKTQATAANNFCDIDGTATWNGPYLENQPASSGTITANSPYSGLSITINQATSTSPMTGNTYYVTAAGVPNAANSKLQQSCNQSTGSLPTAVSITSRCWNAASASGTFTAALMVETDTE